MSDLIRQLRTADDIVPWTGKHGIMTQAADALEAKDKEIARLEALIEQAIANFDEIAAAIEKIPTGGKQA